MFWFTEVLTQFCFLPVTHQQNILISIKNRGQYWCKRGEQWMDKWTDKSVLDEWIDRWLNGWKRTKM